MRCWPHFMTGKVPSRWSTEGAAFLVALCVACGALVATAVVGRMAEPVAATLSAPDLPFAVEGLSYAESWGRWTVGKTARFQFDRGLPRQFELRITAKAFGPNAHRPVRVRVGNETAEIILSEQQETRVLRFNALLPTRAIQFEIPSPTAPASIDRSGDARELGLGLISLAVIPVETA